MEPSDHEKKAARAAREVEDHELALAVARSQHEEMERTKPRPKSRTHTTPRGGRPRTTAPQRQSGWRANLEATSRQSPERERQDTREAMVANSNHEQRQPAPPRPLSEAMTDPSERGIADLSEGHAYKTTEMTNRDWKNLNKQRFWADQDDPAWNKRTALRRTNSMTRTHLIQNTKGVRHQIRFSRTGQDPIHFSMHYGGRLDQGEEAAPALDLWGPNETASGVSANDAEVRALSEAMPVLQNEIKNMQEDDTATIEFHGSEGPCDHCKTRLDKALKKLTEGTRAQGRVSASVFYASRPGERDRKAGRKGEKKATYGWPGDVQIPYGETRGGDPDAMDQQGIATPARVRYPIYAHHLRGPEPEWVAGTRDSRPRAAIPTHNAWTRPLSPPDERNNAGAGRPAPPPRPQLTDSAELDQINAKRRSSTPKRREANKE
jgi:hypothetical protein